MLNSSSFVACCNTEWLGQHGSMGGVWHALTVSEWGSMGAWEEGSLL